MYGYYMPTMYWDWTILLLLPGLILGIIAQAKVRNAYSKYSTVPNRRGITGAWLAQQLLRDNGIYDVPIEPVAGNLTDNYDPRNKVLHLSGDVYQNPTIAAIGIAAHEVGHACQHHDGYAMLQFRNAMAPVVSISSHAVFPILLIGMFVGSQWMLDAAIILYFLILLFQLITLPVELNASRRALAAIERGGYLMEDEIPQARAMLNAAAMTYVAAALSAMLQFLRLVLLFGGRRRR